MSHISAYVTPALLCDLVILVILGFFVISGATRGFLLTLCGLVAVIVAFLGANFVADSATPVIAGMVEPHVAMTVESQLAEYFKEQEIHSLDGLSDSQILEAIHALGFEEINFYPNSDGLLSDGLTQLAHNVASSVTTLVVYCILFLVAFILLLVLWNVLSHTLNLVTRLPVLHSLNSLGGAFLGLFKGCIILFVCAFGIKYLAPDIPSDFIANTKLFHFFMTANPAILILRSISLLPR